MKEKDIINDYLSTLNSSLSSYANMIAQTNNEELRQTLQLMRDQDESRQYRIYNIAKDKGYYKPAQEATQTEISTLKSELTMNK
ncbi:spore coat protein [Clostridium fallax]|uniref:Coat F domain-containing protein n=1 Tax=Clostridium fallax TaxID=1533 RepID=A0A1M4XVF5_9CLOT|nr:spore coat protein [Clostridium fallax]SHE97242.1 Coat F domain-containing protein [Clostridium fallax]SQB06525.1 coat F domain-containing protein [Clostridium fallax]